MAVNHIEVEGVEDLLARLREMTHAMTAPEALRVYLNAARGIRQHVRAAVPVGRGEQYFSGLRGSNARRYSAPGQMKRSVIAMIPKKRYRQQIGGPAAIALIVRRMRRVIGAPHLHLVTLGTKDRKPKTRQRMVMPDYRGVRGRRSGGFAFTTKARGMTANPRIAAAFRQSSGDALQRALTASHRIMERAMRKQTGSAT